MIDPFQVLDACVRPTRFPTGWGGHRRRQSFQVEEELRSGKPQWLRFEQVAEKIHKVSQKNCWQNF